MVGVVHGHIIVLDHVGGEGLSLCRQGRFKIVDGKWLYNSELEEAVKCKECLSEHAARLLADHGMSSAELLNNPEMARIIQENVRSDVFRSSLFPNLLLRDKGKDEK